MMAASHCDCLICRLEATLIAELSDDRCQEQFRSLALSSPRLSVFPSASELIRQLHDPSAHGTHLFSDQLILSLLNQIGDSLLRPMWEKLLLLAFIPTVHRTTSQIAATFPLLARDDIAQHIFTILLEFLYSKDLGSRHSHLAFAIARKMRRDAFRWAIRESRTYLQDEAAVVPEMPIEIEAGGEDSHINIVLQQFLDNCQRRGVLSGEERNLLTKFKLEGISGPELARRNGHSAVAIRHRVQRVVGRLRRFAQKPGRGSPEQFNLFVR
jgi:DNA-directed RNA polymerase specialized sigma24 family protein